MIVARAGAGLVLVASSLVVGGCVANRSQPAMFAPSGAVLALDQTEMTELLKPVSGEGGYQSLLGALQRRVDRSTGSLRLEPDELERIRRYAFEYGQGGWEDRLLRVFGRQLGPKLDGQRQ